jgi:hypothetical protein
VELKFARRVVLRALIVGKIPNPVMTPPSCFAGFKPGVFSLPVFGSRKRFGIVCRTRSEPPAGTGTACFWVQFARRLSPVRKACNSRSHPPMSLNRTLLLIAEEGISCAGLQKNIRPAVEQWLSRARMPGAALNHDRRVNIHMADSFPTC